MGIFNFINNGKKTSDVDSGLPKILIVEDEQYLNDFYSELFTTEGYAVTSAYNGKQALEFIKKNPPHVVILDIMMPVMNGNEVLAALQDEETTKRIPVLVLTNAGNMENKANAHIYNAKFFIKSNIDPDLLIKEVKAALESKNVGL